MDDPTVEPDLLPGESTLAPYLEAAASSKNSASIRAVVVKVLQDPDLFAGYDQIKAVLGGGTAEQGGGGGSVDATLLDTLDLFSYGFYQDYTQEQQQQSNKYLSLNEPQLAKLRQLTVLSLVESSCRRCQNKVSYASIQQALNMAGDDYLVKNRETELILSQLLAARVVVGKLSQKEHAFLIGAAPSTGPLVRPRDVHPSQVANMIAAVQLLRTKLQVSYSYIGEHQNQILLAMEQEKTEKRQLDAKWKKAGGGDNILGGAYDPMDLERAARPVSRRNNKRSRGGFANSIHETLGSVFGSK